MFKLPLGALAILLLAGFLVDGCHSATQQPVALSTRLFEVLEVVLLVACAATCMLLILRVRVRLMLSATVAIVAILLGGELYLSVKPLTPLMLLVELLEIALVVSSSIALAFLVRRTSPPGHDIGG